ncbi:MAG TPA: hypothetical protein VKZ63_07645 [Kofleriaceae bacterium]|nr:hypothetical protein [Kofleriaceae bacterium]
MRFLVSMLIATACAACSGSSDTGSTTPATTEDPAAGEGTGEPAAGGEEMPAADPAAEDDGLPCPDTPACGGE